MKRETPAWCIAVCIFIILAALTFCAVMAAKNFSPIELKHRQMLEQIK